MTDDPQTGGEDEPDDPFANPFANPLAGMGLPFDLSGIDLNEAMRILQSPGPLNWEIARQVAEQVAVEDDADQTIDDATRAEFVELAHTALGPVMSATGRDDVLTLPVEVLDRRAWARRHLEGLRPVLETLATTMQESLAADLDAADDAEVEQLTSGLGLPVGAGGMRGLMGMLGPLLLGAQTGSMVGYLAQYALGAFDLPLPSTDAPTITFVAPNIDRFADAWSLERRDVSLAVAIGETVRAAQRTHPWVRERLIQIAGTTSRRSRSTPRPSTPRSATSIPATRRPWRASRNDPTCSSARSATTSSVRSSNATSSSRWSSRDTRTSSRSRSPSS